MGGGGDPDQADAPIQQIQNEGGGNALRSLGLGTFCMIGVSDN